MAHNVAAGALAGVRVIEMGQLIAGPFAGNTLGDFGANVIKIEPPGTGDPLRKFSTGLWTSTVRDDSSKLRS